MAKKAAAAVDGTKKKKRTKKDPTKPKRAMSSYMFFFASKRLEIVKADPSLEKSIADVAKMIGHEWGKLTPAMKKPFEKQAEEDKKRADRERAIWMKKQPSGE